MKAYIFQADIYCEDCGEDLRKQHYDGKIDLADESSYDSSEFPKGPYCDGGGESDTPQHCASGPTCINAIALPSGCKVGCFLENPLTADGIQYIIDEHNDCPSEITELWLEYYRDYPDDHYRCEHCGHLTPKSGA